MFKKLAEIFRDRSFNKKSTERRNVKKCVIKITDINDTVYERLVHGRAIYKNGFIFTETAEEKAKDIICTYMAKGLMETSLNNFIPRERVRNLEICKVTDHYWVGV